MESATPCHLINKLSFLWTSGTWSLINYTLTANWQLKYPLLMGTVSGPYFQWRQWPRAPHLPLSTGVLAMGDRHLPQVKKHSPLQSSVLAVVAEASNIHACRWGAQQSLRAPEREGVLITGTLRTCQGHPQPLLAKGTSQGIRLQSSLPTYFQILTP